MMSDTLLAGSAAADQSPAPSPSRHDRAPLIAFVNDSGSETALRQGLADVTPDGMEVRRGGVRAAIAALQKMPTPRVLVVDVSGEDSAIAVLALLSEVTEPDVQVLVIGEHEGLDFYRQLTRGMGVLEYLARPLTRDAVARHFGPLIAGQRPHADSVRGGSVVSVTGVRGGVGATTIAANLAWHFGVTARRHTVLLDADLHMGTAAMLLDAKTGPGLRTALEAPDRIDELFMERAAQPLAGRLHVLAGEEGVSERPAYAPGAASDLLAALRRRYSIIVADVPFAPVPLYRDLLELATQRVLVMEPTLASIRDTLRLFALPHGKGQSRRAIVVLNRLGLPGGLTRRQVEDALKMKVDAVIPNLPKQIEAAANLGEPAVVGRSGFRSAIIELARLTGSAGADAPGSPAAAPPGRRWRLFRKAS